MHPVARVISDDVGFNPSTQRHLIGDAKNTDVGICHADYVASSMCKKSALTSLTSGGRLVGIVRLRTEAMEFFFI
jgi:hypothetical protein